MENIVLDQNSNFKRKEIFYLNSFISTYKKPLYLSSQHNNYISLQDIQKRKIKKKSTPTRSIKKIVLGKPYDGKQKMNIKELKALSRQIKPSLDNSNDINLISKNLKENMIKAKSRVLNQLKDSNLPQDIQIVDILQQHNNNSITTSDSEEDDQSSIHTNFSLKTQTLYTHHNTSHNSLFTNLQHLSNSLSIEKTNITTEYTEDQINSWLQRGGYYTLTPMTMATDQELADLLNFDSI